MPSSVRKVVAYREEAPTQRETETGFQVMKPCVTLPRRGLRACRSPCDHWSSPGGTLGLPTGCARSGSGRPFAIPILMIWSWIIAAVERGSH